MMLQLVSRLVTMKTVVILLGLVALALCDAHHKYETKKVDDTFVAKQKKVLSLLEHVYQVYPEADYYKVGTEYKIEEHVEDYKNQQAVKDFISLWKSGFLPRDKVFSIFYPKMRQEAIALFHMFFYAKDFDTFYKTAAFARVYMNSGQFLYSFYIAIIQRPDTQGIVLPAPYEIYPEYFNNMNTLSKLRYTKEQGSLNFPKVALQYGIKQEENKYFFYSNYSSSYVFNNDEQRLAYYTEDVGLNAYYYWFHAQLPFWWNGDKWGPFKERRGEVYYFFYKQLLNRYYFERLTNGLDEIPEFSWFSQIETGYYPLMYVQNVPLAQRPDYYNANIEDNFENIMYLDSFEKSFLQFLESGHFKAFDEEVDFHDPKALNFVGNYWQFNADLFHENFTQTYQRSYEATARHILDAAPYPVDKYNFLPSVLDFYQTSLRDPAFYQLYDRIVKYIVQFKRYLTPYTHEQLSFKGVKINDVHVDKLITYFDHYEYNIDNGVFYTNEQLKSYPTSYWVRQPRLNHKHFSMSFNVESEKATKAVFRVFLGPKYDSKGFPVPIEENWTKFLLLDYFPYDLEAGKNEIKRGCDDFYFYRDDSVPMRELWKLLDQGVVPKDMSVVYDAMPKRLMIPKGTKDGYPFQLYIFAYPYEEIPKEYEPFKEYAFDTKPFSYPFDRPVQYGFFNQPNMFFKDIAIYHEGEMYPYQLNQPQYFEHEHNVVPK